MPEMIDDLDPTPEYLKGFNLGYQLSRFEPETYDKVLSTVQDSDYFNAVKAGRKQFEKEKLIEQIKQEKDRPKDRGR